MFPAVTLCPHAPCLTGCAWARRLSRFSRATCLRRSRLDVYSPDVYGMLETQLQVPTSTTHGSHRTYGQVRPGALPRPRLARSSDILSREGQSRAFLSWSVHAACRLTRLATQEARPLRRSPRPPGTHLAQGEVETADSTSRCREGSPGETEGGS